MKDAPGDGLVNQKNTQPLADPDKVAARRREIMEGLNDPQDAKKIDW